MFRLEADEKNPLEMAVYCPKRPESRTPTGGARLKSLQKGCGLRASCAAVLDEPLLLVSAKSESKGTTAADAIPEIVRNVRRFKDTSLYVVRAGSSPVDKRSAVVKRVA